MTASDKVRDHLANERTFLAWVRTCIALLGFGVVIARLRFLIAALPVNAGAAVTMPGAGGRSLALGLLFCATGVVTLILSVLNYTRTRRMIDAEDYAPSAASVIVFAVVVAALGIASIVFLLDLNR